MREKGHKRGTTRTLKAILGKGLSSSVLSSHQLLKFHIKHDSFLLSDTFVLEHTGVVACTFVPDLIDMEMLPA